MSIKNWNAGIIRPVAVAPAGPYQDGAAPGVWTLDQAAFWQKQGLWPIAGNVLQRGLYGGGYESVGFSSVNVIQYITITSTGNTTDFGDLTVGRYQVGACSSSTRGVFSSGYATSSGSVTNILDYVTILTTGNAVDFGDATWSHRSDAGLSNDTRGVFCGGQDPTNQGVNTIFYITIASTGNAVNFGNLAYKTQGSGACASTTRGIIAGGYVSPGSPNDQNNINYITIATTGNATDFGDLTSGVQNTSGCSSNTRGLIAGGSAPGGVYFNINYLTIASLGNAANFGNLTLARTSLAACSSNLRGVFLGGIAVTYENIIDYVTISSTGNATDFGDLTFLYTSAGACSNVHGGL